jgi:hypothetical protein
MWPTIALVGHMRLVGALPASGWLGRTLWASASPRSRIVFNDFWGLSRRERCLDKPQKSLRAAWIGVMQKNWARQGYATSLWLVPGGV